MKKKKNMFNKKKAALMTDVVLWIVALLAIGISIFLTTTSATESNNILEESAPVIQYQYPVLYLNSFLNEDLTISEISEINLDENKKYKIKDIIRFWEKSQDLIYQKAEEYNIEQADKQHGSLKYYKSIAKETVSENSLINFKEIDSDSDLNVKLQDCRNDVQNYCFYFKTDDDKYIVVSFEQVIHQMTSTELSQMQIQAWTRPGRR